MPREDAVSDLIVMCALRVEGGETRSPPVVEGFRNGWSAIGDDVNGGVRLGGSHPVGGGVLGVYPKVGKVGGQDIEPG